MLITNSPAPSPCSALGYLCGHTDRTREEGSSPRDGSEEWVRVALTQKASGIKRQQVQCGAAGMRLWSPLDPCSTTADGTRPVLPRGSHALAV